MILLFFKGKTVVKFDSNDVSKKEESRNVQWLVLGLVGIIFLLLIVLVVVLKKKK